MSRDERRWPQANQSINESIIHSINQSILEEGIESVGVWVSEYLCPPPPTPLPTPKTKFPPSSSPPGSTLFLTLCTPIHARTPPFPSLSHLDCLLFFCGASLLSKQFGISLHRSATFPFPLSSRASLIQQLPPLPVVDSPTLLAPTPHTTHARVSSRSRPDLCLACRLPLPVSTR